MKRMKGKTVLIVGGTSGIGFALAKKVSDAGARVIVSSRSKHKESYNFDYISVDLTVDSDVADLVGIAGNIDHLAITIKSPLVVENFLEINNDDVRNAFETKFWGQYNLVKKIHKNINTGGSITMTSGSLGIKPHKGFSTMSAVAGAVDSLCRSLALELAPLRVNSVSPGFKTLEELKDKIPLGLGTSQQMANSYFYLMNDDYVTGTNLITDGGALLV